ncbi:MAG: polysaccharide biosynthesis/export family protein [Candidatus Sulfotelmatobacter sp.]|jgi:polysaccharide export outer membrane protein
MEFSRFRFGRGIGSAGFALILVSGWSLNVHAQNAPGSTAGSPVPALPAVEPISQAAVRSTAGETDSVKSGSAGSNDLVKSNLVRSGDATLAKSGDIGEERSASRLRLGPGDLIEINVYNVPELSTKARVGNSGDVYLPLIDYVHVGGLTVEEAQGLMQKRLEDGGFVRSAHVTLLVDESASQGVTILGEVNRPGIYPAMGQRKLYDFISAAGGFSATAGRKVSIIRENSVSGAVTLNLPRNLAEDMKDDVEILPGDTISVPRAPVIYVVGDVGRPAGLLVDNGSLTVLQALAMAGGANHTAKMGGVRIIRKSATGMTETRVPLKKILEAKAPDWTLQADDILFVPLSGFRQAASQGISAAVSAASGLAVVAAHP